MGCGSSKPSTTTETPWKNIPVKFETKNTLNGYGNSVYTVTAESVSRYAPINKDRAPDQVNTSNECISYVDSATANHLLDEIHNKNAAMQLKSVSADSAIITVSRTGHKEEINVSLKPETGLNTFDFTLIGKTLRQRHIGHEVYKILS